MEGVAKEGEGHMHNWEGGPLQVGRVSRDELAAEAQKVYCTTGCE